MDTRIAIPALEFRPAEPLNLLEVLEAQVRSLIAIGSPNEAGVTEAKYLDDAMNIARQYVWRLELAEIGFVDAVLVDYRLPGQFLAEAGGVYCVYPPDDCTLFNAIALPDGIVVAQFQWGTRNKGMSPAWSMEHFSPLEQGGTVKEGLTGFLYGGNDLLRLCYMDLPGSVSPGGFVPYLDLSDGGPYLDDGRADYAYPFCGSVSRGRS